MELSVAESLWASLPIAGALGLLHLAAPRIRRLPLVPEPATASFAGGIAVAYVFMHLLPELGRGNQAVGRALDDVVDPTPLLELALFAVALTGFVAFYGLERLARRHGERGMGGRVFTVHLGAFCIYNGLITYTMPLRLRTGVDFALLFSVAMGLHFVLTDRGLSASYPRRYSRYGRFVLAGALVAGWLAVALAAPTSTVLVAVLTALLAGSLLLNVFKEELPSDRGSHFSWFLAGVLLYAGLLAGVTALSE